MTNNNNEIQLIKNELNDLKSKIDLIKDNKQNINTINEDQDEKLDLAFVRLDNQKYSIDNLTDQFRDVDGHIELEFDIDHYASKDFVKEQLLLYERKTIDHIDSIAGSGFDEELRDTISNINTNITVEKGRISSAISQIEDLDGVIRSLGTKIEQTAEAIKSTATDYNLDRINQQIVALESFRVQTAGKIEDTVRRTEIDLVNDRITDQESSIVQLFDSIESTVTKREFEDMTIGTINLLRHSTVMKGNYQIYGTAGTISFKTDEKRPYVRVTIDNNSDSDTIGIRSVGLIPELPGGKRYTISFSYRSSSINRLNYNYLLNSNGNKSVSRESNIELETNNIWRRYHFTFSLNRNENMDGSTLLIGLNKGSIPQSGYFDIADIQIEEGDKPSTWTAAPEDFDEFFENYRVVVDGEFSDIKDGALGLNKTLTEAFEDGIITEAEAKAIIQDKQMLTKEKEDIDKIFNNLYNNTYLSSSSRTSLSNAYNAYHQAHNVLTQNILNVIKDGVADKEEIDMVETNFINYNTKVSEVREAISEAMMEINNSYTVEQVENIAIGGKNLISTSNIRTMGTTTVDHSEYSTTGDLTFFTSYQYGGIIFTFDKIKPSHEYIIHYSYYKNAGSGPVNGWGGIIGNSDTIERYQYFHDGQAKNIGSNSFTVTDTAGLHNVIIKFKTTANVTESPSFYIQPNRFNPNHNTNTDVTILDLMGEEGNKPTSWNPSVNDINSRFTETESKITQADDQIKLRVTRETYEENGRLVNEALSAITILADGINLTSSEDGLISEVDINPSNIKIKSDLIEINDGDVVIKNGKTSITQAFIDQLDAKAIDAGRITIGNYKLGNNNKIESQRGHITLEGDTLLAHHPNDASKYVRLNSSGLHITKGAITIERPDGALFMESGMVQYEFAVFQSSPSFTSSAIRPAARQAFYETTSSTYRTMNYFTFRKSARYLRVNTSVVSLTPGTRVKVRVTRAGTHSGSPEDVEVLWSGEKAYHNRDAYGKLQAQVDLGVPDYRNMGVYVAFAISTEGSTAWCKIDSIYLFDDVRFTD